MVRHPAPSSLNPTSLALAAALFSLALGGCYSNDVVDPDHGSTGPIPVLAPEPAFSPGHQNTVSWSFSVDGNFGTAEWEFLVQRSSDPLFARDVEESGWTADMSFEFTGLQHESVHHYRVQARHPQGKETPWSPSQVSTQDADLPQAALAELKDEQTSLLFTFELSGVDETSGIDEIELWFSLEGGEPSYYGVFPPGVVSFQAAGGGNHEFFPVAIDVAGNRQERGATPAGTTLVPEPIIIIDNWGEEFDITAAVLEYRMAVTYWEFGLGRYTIRPVIDPRMVSAGEPGYPRSNSMQEYCAVKYGEDLRAYALSDMNSHEVVDDVVNGIPIAVCY